MKQNDVLTTVLVPDWLSDRLSNLDWSMCSRPDVTLKPDAALVVVSQHQVRARCGLWWRETPCFEHCDTGLIGQYEAHDRMSAHRLLGAAVDRLAQASKSLVMGPMDGDTWHNHRFVVESDDDASFPLEPRQPATWVSDWTSAGFEPMVGYHSSIAPLDGQSDPRVSEVRDRLTAKGVSLRSFNLDAFDNELTAIHRLSLDSFKNNRLYRPLSLDAFLDLYRPLKHAFDPHTSAIAQGPDGILGFVFCYPADTERLVIKTLAIAPGRAWSGLGTWLLDHTYQSGHRVGFQHAIHALMQDDNPSTRMRSNQTRRFRRYALLGRSVP